MALYAYVLAVLVTTALARPQSNYDFASTDVSSSQPDTMCAGLSSQCITIRDDDGENSTVHATATQANVLGTNAINDVEVAAAPTIGPSRSVGKTPALGWNPWYVYRCGSVNESIVLDAAEQLVILGLAEAGYKYVNIDDCWSSKTRDASGRIAPDPTRFPQGMASVGNIIHLLGLKFGILSSSGTETCGDYVGSLGNEGIDAETFAEWGVDYLKDHNCHVPANWTDSPTPPNGDWYNSNTTIRYRQMTAALNATGRPIEFSISTALPVEVWQWGARVGHSWRIGGNSSPDWAYMSSILIKNTQHLDAVDFYSHNDMDMIQVGNGNMTAEEQRTNFAAWCFLKSPILITTKLNNLTSAQIEILTNRELLAFSQDEIYGKPAMPFAPTPSATITSPPGFYAGQSSAGTHVFFINIGTTSTSMTIDFANVPGLPSGQWYIVHDMWTGEDIGIFTGSYTTTVASHDTVAFLLTRFDIFDGVQD